MLGERRSALTEDRRGGYQSLAQARSVRLAGGEEPGRFETCCQRTVAQIRGLRGRCPVCADVLLRGDDRLEKSRFAGAALARDEDDVERGTRSGLREVERVVGQPPESLGA
jgi:hypothetical protein